MEKETRLRKLKAFVRSVESNTDWRFRLGDFDDRVRLQKYVFLAGVYGYSHDYDYNMYHYGPYSPKLARDYYDNEFSSMSAADGLDGFDISKFIELVEGRDRIWLEVAATIKSIHARYIGEEDESTLRDWVISRSAEIKEESPEYVDTIYSELSDEGLLSGE